MNNKPLPNNLEAERAVIGICLNNSSAINEVVGVLSQDSFYSTSHKIIYNTLMYLYKNNIEINVVTLCEQLGDKLREVGGVTYISEIMSEYGGYENIKAYAVIVKDKQNRRKLINIFTNSCSLVYDNNSKVKEIIDTAVEDISSVSTNKDDKMQHISKALETSFKQLNETFKAGKSMLGIQYGFPELDRITGGLQKGEVVVIAARPSMGKTALALNLVENLTLRDNSVILFSLEMSTPSIIQRLSSSICCIPLKDFKNGTILESQLYDISNKYDSLGRKKLYIDDTAEITTNEIKAKCKKIKIQQGLDIVFIDYIGLINGSGENRVQEISNISRSLKNIARELDITIVVLSQLNRAVDARIDHRPMLSDLRESGAIEQDADLVLLLYRDEYYNQDSKDKGLLEVIVAKNRNGSVGTFKMVWIPQYQRICPLTDIKEYRHTA